jgi:Na+-transporting methylmalonyl-CoA/oxaloacetate decarboxylase gamma subunit
MASIEFGLTVAAYGFVSVFIILLSVILYTEIIKRIFGSKTPFPEQLQKEALPLSEEEIAAISAAITSFIEESSETPHTAKFIQTSSKWDQAGRVEAINRRLRG